MSRSSEIPSSDAAAVEPLGPDDVHIWLIQPESVTDADVLSRCHQLLCAEEEERRLRYRFESLRHDFVVARALVRTTLSRYVGLSPADWRFVANDYGRPEIESPETARSLRFNLSHTRGLAACAVAWVDDLGVDVEAMDRQNSGIPIARRFFSTSEVDELMSFAESDQSRRFFDYWTLKESYIKARGMGLAIPLDQFSFCIREAEVPSISFTPPLEDDPAHWQFVQSFPTERHRMALALERPRQRTMNVSGRWATLDG